MNGERVRELVATLVAAWPSARIGEQTLAVYESELGELRNADALAAAVRTLVHESRRFPSIAEVREVYFMHERRDDERRRTAEWDRAGARADTVGLPAGPPPPPPRVPQNVREWMQAMGYSTDHLLRSMPGTATERSER